MNIHAIYAFCRNQWKLNVTIILWQKGVMSVVWGFQPEIQINRPIEDYLQSSLSHLAWMHEIFRLYVFWVFTEGIQYRTHEQWISNLINYEYTCDLRILQKSIKVECHDYLMAERCNVSRMAISAWNTKEPNELRTDFRAVCHITEAWNPYDILHVYWMAVTNKR